MKRCFLCWRRVWPWQLARHSGTGTFHRTCYANITRIFEEDADRWERAVQPGAHAAWCYLPKGHSGLCEGDQ